MASKIQRGFTGLHCAVYRATHGGVWSTVHGAPVLLLRTVGRRTGQQRETPVLYLEDGERYVVVASNSGSSGNPCWYLNLVDNPDVDIQIGGDVRHLRAHLATPSERNELWGRLTAQFPGYDKYQARTERQIPVVVLEPK